MPEKNKLRNNIKTANLSRLHFFHSLRYHSEADEFPTSYHREHALTPLCLKFLVSEIAKETNKESQEKKTKKKMTNFLWAWRSFPSTMYSCVCSTVSLIAKTCFKCSITIAYWLCVAFASRSLLIFSFSSGKHNKVSWTIRRLRRKEFSAKFQVFSNLIFKD